MATVSKVYTPANIWQGPADVFLDVPAPESHNPPTADVDEITIDTNGQPPTGGIHVGSTEGPAEITITEKFNEIRDDQHESVIDQAFDSVEAELSFTVKETDLQNLLKYLADDSLGAYTALAASKVLQLGGQVTSAVNFRTLMLIAPNRAVSGKWIYVFAFKVMLKSAIQLTFQRSKENSHKLTFGCVANLTRVAGDEVLQLVKQK